MATALEFLKEQLSGVGGLIATALKFLKEQLSGVGGLIATALEYLMEHPSGYSGALQDMRKEIEEALKGLKERLGDDHPQKEELLQGLKNSIAEFHWGELSNLLLVLKNKTNELGGALQVTKEATSQFLQEKLPWVIALWAAAVDFLVQKLEALLPPGTSSDTVLSNLLLVLKNKTNELGDALQVTKEATSQFLQEKLPWVIALWTAAVDFLVQKLAALLPPGTRSDTVRIWVQLVVPLLLFLSLRILRKYFVPILQFFLCGCFVLVRYTMIACAKASYWAIVMTKAFARAAWGGGKMMKAPGRQGLRISRAVFESNPGGYFRALHANAPFLGESSMSRWFIVVAGLVAAGVVLLKLL